MRILKYILMCTLGCSLTVMSAVASTTVKSASNQLQWHKAHKGELPKNALVAGYSKKGPIYMCSAPFQGAIYPGQLTKKGCHITYAGNAFYSQNYQVLAGQTANVSWDSRSSYGYYNTYSKATHMYGYVPQGLTITDKNYHQPVVGGYESKSPNYLHVLYVCRTIAHNEIHVGKVVGTHCDIGVNGREYYIPVNQVLNWEPNNDGTLMKPLQTRMMGTVASIRAVNGTLMKPLQTRMMGTVASIRAVPVTRILGS